MNEQFREIIHLMFAMMAVSMGSGMVKPVMLQSRAKDAAFRGGYRKIDGWLIPIKYAPLKEES